MAGKEDQDDWVRLVLGVSVSRPIRSERIVATSVNFQKLRLQWAQSQKRAAAEMQKLKQVILDHTAETDLYDDVLGGISVLDDSLKHFDDRLVDKLDEIYVCEDQAKRPRLVGEAKALINEYATYIAKEELLQAVDGDSGFEIVNVCGEMTGTLQQLSNALR